MFDDLKKNLNAYNSKFVSIGEPLRKAEKAASHQPGAYGNVKPHAGHVEMAQMTHGTHYDLHTKHRHNAAIAQAKGDHELAEKHSKMAQMHDHYKKGIAVDHREIDHAKKLHSELSS